MTTLFVAATISLTAVYAQAGTVCAATCLVSMSDHEISGSKTTMSAVGTSLSGALTELVDKCQKSAESLNRNNVTAQLYTSYKANPKDGRGVEISFSVKDACSN